MGKSLLDLSHNPIRLLRHRLGKTVQAAADEAGIHWQAWYMTECGCYNDVPPKISIYLKGKGYGFSDEDYQNFRLVQQRIFGEEYLKRKGLPAPTLAVPPITEFRKYHGIRSRTSFAKGLCVQPALLYKLEHGMVKYLPDQLYQALLQAGLPVEEVEELDNRTTEYYESH